MDILSKIILGLSSFLSTLLPININKIQAPPPATTVFIKYLPSSTPVPIIPSESSLKISAFIVIEATDAQVNSLKERIGIAKDSDKTTFVKAYALYLDKNPEIKAMNQALMEKIIAKRNVPIINNPASIIQNNTQSNTINCRTFNIGDTTYTNCK